MHWRELCLFHHGFTEEIERYAHHWLGFSEKHRAEKVPKLLPMPGNREKVTPFYDLILCGIPLLR